MDRPVHTRRDRIKGASLFASIEIGDPIPSKKGDDRNYIFGNFNIIELRTLYPKR